MKNTNIIRTNSPQAYYHPFIRKVVPKPVLEFSEDFSINQYMLMFFLTAVGMGALFLTGVFVTKMMDIYSQ